MKRLLTLVLALAMVLSLAACGSKKPVQLTADGGAVVVLSADANNAVTSLSVAFRKQLAAKLGGDARGRVQLSLRRASRLPRRA